MNTAIIGVGSNINPETNIELAKEHIASKMILKESSSFIETEPLGYKEQDNFLNGAFLIETEMNLKNLKKILKDIEKKLGRIKTTRKSGPRTIDLDIIIWNDEIVDNDFYKRDFLKKSVLELIPKLEF